MKKVVLTFIIMLVGLSSFANDSDTFTKVIFENVSIEEPQNLISIEIDENGDIQSFEFGFRTLEELQNFEIELIRGELIINNANHLECEVSITVKVRIGFDSNFVEASATMSGIPCGDVVSAIKSLKAQLMAGIE